ncbi:MAG: hypothetical protein MMC33_002772 [Icmadophila ericetorum]|nr:hypothetical protein [Icmadophila ericetorum]
MEVHSSLSFLFLVHSWTPKAEMMLNLTPKSLAAGHKERLDSWKEDANLMLNDWCDSLPEVHRVATDKDIKAFKGWRYLRIGLPNLMAHYPGKLEKAWPALLELSEARLSNGQIWPKTLHEILEKQQKRYITNDEFIAITTATGEKAADDQGVESVSFFIVSDRGGDELPQIADSAGRLRATFGDVNTEPRVNKSVGCKIADDSGGEATGVKIPVNSEITGDIVPLSVEVSTVPSDHGAQIAASPLRGNPHSRLLSANTPNKLGKKGKGEAHGLQNTVITGSEVPLAVKRPANTSALLKSPLLEERDRFAELPSRENPKLMASKRNFQIQKQLSHAASKPAGTEGSETRVNNPVANITTVGRELVSLNTSNELAGERARELKNTSSTKMTGSEVPRLIPRPPHHSIQDMHPPTHHSHSSPRPPKVPKLPPMAIDREVHMGHHLDHMAKAFNQDLTTAFERLKGQTQAFSQKFDIPFDYLNAQLESGFSDIDAEAKNTFISLNAAVRTSRKPTPRSSAPTLETMPGHGLHGREPGQYVQALGHNGGGGIISHVEAPNATRPKGVDTPRKILITEQLINRQLGGDMAMKTLNAGQQDKSERPVKRKHIENQDETFTANHESKKLKPLPQSTLARDPKIGQAIMLPTQPIITASNPMDIIGPQLTTPSPSAPLLNPSRHQFVNQEWNKSTTSQHNSAVEIPIPGDLCCATTRPRGFTSSSTGQIHASIAATEASNPISQGNSAGASTKPDIFNNSTSQNPFSGGPTSTGATTIATPSTNLSHQNASVSRPSNSSRPTYPEPVLFPSAQPQINNSDDNRKFAISTTSQATTPPASHSTNPHQLQPHPPSKSPNPPPNPLNFTPARLLEAGILLPNNIDRPVRQDLLQGPACAADKLTTVDQRDLWLRCILRCEGFREREELRGRGRS